MKAPSPERIDAAAKVLRLLAAQERKDDDTERARLLDKAAEICEAKAFVGGILQTIEKMPGRLK